MLENIWKRLVFYLRRAQFDRELEEEMRFHLDMKTEENLTAGMETEEARYAARRQFGNLTLLREVSHEMWGFISIERLFQDLRYGVRMLRKHKGFSAVAVLSLALGIGANTAIFSLVEAVLLRPLPFQEPGRLVMIWEASSDNRSLRNNPAPGNYSDWRTQNRVFEDVAAFSNLSLNFIGDGEPEKINGQAVSADYFSLLGSKPALGRTFLEADDGPEAGKVVLLSYGLWQRRFGGDPNLVGRDILLNDQKFTVIGVMPAGFQLLGADVGLWIPAAFSQRDLADRGSHYLTVIARLKTAVTLEQAQADLETITERIAREFPRDASNLWAFVLPLHEHLAGGMRLALIVLLAAVGCVLLIACANIANLLLARAAARRKEIAVRAALGAGRLRIVRQLLTESVLLASLGGAIGLLFAFWSFAFLKELIPESMAVTIRLGLSAPVFGYTLLLTLLTGVSFGIAPALQAAKLDLSEALKQSGGRTGFGTSHRRLRGALVVVEVSLALVLLVGAGLLIQTFVRLRNLDPGFRSENVLTVTTSLSRNKYDPLASLYRQMFAHLEAVPGVLAVTCSSESLLSGSSSGLRVYLAGSTFATGPDNQPVANGDTRILPVRENYLEAMEIPLLLGRALRPQDDERSPKVVVANQAFVRRFFPNENPLGKRFGFSAETAQNIEIVGVARDAKYTSLREEIRPNVYLPWAQGLRFAGHMSFALRASGNPTALVSAVREALHEVDRNLPFSDVKTQAEQANQSLRMERLFARLLSFFGPLALLLASIGLYGVLAYSVAQRTQEIGIRLALGAQTGDILRLVVGQGMTLASVGVALGVGGAIGLTQLMQSLLYGVQATDPLTFIVITLLLSVVTLLACYLPARRAARVDPMVALRYE